MSSFNEPDTQTERSMAESKQHRSLSLGQIVATKPDVTCGGFLSSCVERVLEDCRLLVEKWTTSSLPLRVQSVSTQGHLMQIS